MHKHTHNRYVHYRETSTTTYTEHGHGNFMMESIGLVPKRYLHSRSIKLGVW